MTGRDCESGRCDGCSADFVCHCMKVTAEALVEVIVSLEVRTLRELRQHTGAGDGCMACRKRLQHYIDEYSPASRAIPLAMAG
jgi:bacterioferritin-associated ferredoxin